MNYQELQEQLYSLLTEEEKKAGHCYVTYDILSSTMVIIGEDDLEFIFRKSKYRDYIVGFKRGKYQIDLILDEEGQEKWDKDVRKAEEFMAKYGCD